MDTRLCDHDPLCKDFKARWISYDPIPYLLWITFAGYLAYTIYLINP